MAGGESGSSTSSDSASQLESELRVEFSFSGFDIESESVLLFAVGGGGSEGLLGEGLSFGSGEVLTCGDFTGLKVTVGGSGTVINSSREGEQEFELLSCLFSSVVDLFSSFFLSRNFTNLALSRRRREGDFFLRFCELKDCWCWLLQDVDLVPRWRPIAWHALS